MSMRGRKRKQAAKRRTNREADTTMVNVSRVDLDLRPDGEPVMKRVRRCDMQPGDIELDLGGDSFTQGSTNLRTVREATFELPEMDGPVTLPASREGQRDAVMRLMEKHRPHQVYGRDWTLSGGAWR